MCLARRPSCGPEISLVVNGNSDIFHCAAGAQRRGAGLRRNPQGRAQAAGPQARLRSGTVEYLRDARSVHRMPTYLIFESSSKIK